MAGRFEGLSDLEWKLFEDIFPNEPKKRGKGMPHTPYVFCIQEREKLRESVLLKCVYSYFQVNRPRGRGTALLIRVNLT